MNGRAPAAAALLLAVTAACARPDGSAGDEPDGLEAYVDEIFAQEQPGASPGGAVAVMRDGEVVLRKFYGMANVEHGVPIGEETVFDVASLAKMFTGFAVARLVTEDRLSLDEPVRSIVPELPEYAAEVTVGELVHHTSGIRDWVYQYRTAGGNLYGDVISFDYILRHVFRQESLAFEPGSRYAYSNANYNLLAEIIARRTGTPFPEWMTDNVFAHFGMTATEVRTDERQIVPGVAEPYFVENGHIRRGVDQLTAWGSSSVFTTLGDLVEWIRAIESAQGEDASVFEGMQQPGLLDDGTPTRYAFGVGVLDHRGLRLQAHSGAWAAYTSTLLHYPELRTAIIVLSNAGNIDAPRAGAQIARVFLGDEFTGPEAGAVAPQPRPAAGPAGDWDDAVLDEFAGTYSLEATEGLLLTVRREQDRLLIARGSEPEMAMSRQGPSTFLLPDGETTVTFHSDERGAASGLTIHRGTDYVAERIASYEPDAGKLQEYAGRYFSPVLATGYRFFVREAVLYGSHPRTGDFPLTPLSADRFGGGPAYFAGVQFTRDEHGRVTGLIVTAEGVSGLEFDRLQ